MQTTLISTPRNALLNSAIRTSKNLAAALANRITGVTESAPTGNPAAISLFLRQFLAPLDNHQLIGPDGTAPTTPMTLQIRAICDFLSELSSPPNTQSPGLAAGASPDLLAGAINEISARVLATLQSATLEPLATVDDYRKQIKTPPRKEGDKGKRRDVDNSTNEEGIPRENVADNQMKAEDIPDREAGRGPRGWAAVFEDKFIPCRPLVVVDGAMMDLHHIYAARRGQEHAGKRNPWKPYQYNDANKCPQAKWWMECLDIDQEQLFQWLPSITYSWAAVERGLPCPLGFHPIDVRCDDHLLKIERSIFGFYRIAIADESTLTATSEISARYIPTADHVEHRRRSPEERLCNWAGKLQLSLQPDAHLDVVNLLPLEVHDELVLHNLENEDSDDLTRQMIIALNLGYSQKCGRLDALVGVDLTQHLLARRFGSCLHQTIILSTILHALKKPNVIVGGVFFGKPADHVEVWSQGSRWGGVLRVDPTFYSSPLSGKQDESLTGFTRAASDASTKDIDPEELGQSARACVGAIPYEIGIPEEYLFRADEERRRSAKDDYSNRLLESYVDYGGGIQGRRQNDLLIGSGRIPLRVELQRCAERLGNDGRCDELLKLYLSRRTEIHRDITARQAIVPPSDKASPGPGSLIMGLLRAAFRENRVKPEDLTANTAHRSSDELPVGAVLLAEIEFLTDLGTNESQIFQILRRSPRDLSTVFHSRLKRALRPPHDDMGRPQQRYLDKSDWWCEDLVAACRQMVECINSEDLATDSPNLERAFLDRKDPFCCLFSDLVAGYQVACQIRDAQLKNSIGLAGEAIGRCFPKIPTFFDYEGYAEGEEERTRTRSPRHPHFDEAFNTLLASVVRTNNDAARYFALTRGNELVLTNEGGLRFARRWSEDIKRLEKTREIARLGRKFPLFREADYLSFLCARIAVPQDVRSLIGDSIKDDVAGALFEERGMPGMPMPLTRYPMGALVFLSNILFDYHPRISNPLDQIFTLLEIGVLDDQLASEEFQTRELALQEQVIPTAIKMGEHADLKILLKLGDKAQCVGIPSEAVLRSALDLNTPKLTEDSRVFLAMYPELAVSIKSSSRLLPRPVARRYDAVLKQLRNTAPHIYKMLLKAATKAHKSREKGAFSLADSVLEAPKIQTAAGVLKVGLMHELVTAQTSVSQLPARADSIRANIRSDIAERGGLDSDGGYNHDTIPMIPGARDFFLRAGSHIPHYFASCSDDWASPVVEAWEARDASDSWQYGDTVDEQWCPVSPAERAVRLLLAADGGAFSTPLDVSEIQAMAQALASQTGFRGWSQPLRGARMGSDVGRHRSFDPSGEFDSLSQINPNHPTPIRDVYWARSGGDMLYRRNTVNGEEKRVTVIINAAPLWMSMRWLSQLSHGHFFGTDTVRNLLGQLIMAGLLAPSTRFMIRSHGSGTVNFSMRDLDRSIPLPLTSEALRGAQALNTPLERLIAMLVIAGLLKDRAAPLKPLANRCSLFEMRQDAAPLPGNKFVLVSGIHELPADAEAVRPLTHGPLYCVQVVPQTHEVELLPPLR